jgi:hypothetical protein
MTERSRCPTSLVSGQVLASSRPLTLAFVIQQRFQVRKIAKHLRRCHAPQRTFLTPHFSCPFFSQSPAGTVRKSANRLQSSRDQLFGRGRSGTESVLMSADGGGPRRSHRSNGQRPGSFRLSSDEYAASQTSPPPQRPRPSASNKSNKTTTSSPSSSSLEEGDFVWVRDESGVCTSAVVVRTGFLYDEESEQEQHVTVVHTEDGEERAIRDRPLVKLPACHHPKQLLPLELHDLSNVPLMATNVSFAGRTCFLFRIQIRDFI